MTGSHEGRTAVVTGAGSGFGRATAVELARRGADVVIVDLRQADDVVAEIEALGRRATALVADVSDPDRVAELAGRLTELTGAVDVLVNNAGIFPHEDVWTLTFERFREIQRINLDSQFLMTKAVIGACTTPAKYDTMPSSRIAAIGAPGNRCARSVPMPAPIAGIMGRPRFLTASAAP